MEELDRLAEELNRCKKAYRKNTLEYVLEAGRILEEAKSAAHRNFGAWLQTAGRTSRETAHRYIRVKQFVDRNVSLMTHFRTLGTSKLYALSTLEVGTALRCIHGSIRFSAPMAELSDMAFRREFLEKFPAPVRRKTRANAYLQVRSAVSRLRRSLIGCSRFFSRFTAKQRMALRSEIRLLVQRLETSQSESA